MNYYNLAKLVKTYKQNHHVVRSKRRPRLSEMEINGKIDETARKKLIKRIQEAR